MSRDTTVQLNLENLEAREVPAAFGTPWMDPLRMTVSFAPDGTTVGEQGSNLSAELGQKFTETAWKTELLKAIQTWVSQANLNVGLVSDSGADFGSSAAAQYEFQYGDLRFGAVSISGNALAQSSPFQAILGSWSGDILLNSDKIFGTGSNGSYHLYTVALQEVGHALGLGNNDDDDSVMFDDYQGTRTSLDSEDVQAIRSLYGARQKDTYDVVTSNGSSSKASLLSLGTSSSPKTATVMADITTASDIDFYKFTAHTTGSTRFDLRTAGLSLLTGSLTVYDANMNQLGTVTNSDPLRSSSLSLSLNLTAGKNYFVRVRAASGSFFNVGAYQLQVAPPNQYVSQQLPSPFSMTLADSTSFSDATVLTSSNGSSYGSVGLLTSSSDVDYFKFTILEKMSGQGGLTLGVASFLSTSISPVIDLYNAQGTLISGGKTLVNQDTNHVVQFTGYWKQGDVYYARIRSTSAGYFGMYGMAIDYQATPTAMVTAANLTLSKTTPQAAQGFQVKQSELYHFVLTATGTQSTAGVRMTIRDASGNVVNSLVARAGETITTRVWLTAGNYTIHYAAGTSDGAALQNLTVKLEVLDTADSIDPYLVDDDDDDELSQPSGGTPDDYSLWWLSTASWLVATDPYSQPFWY